MAAPCGQEQIGILKIREMDQYLDFWNLMAYDVSGEQKRLMSSESRSGGARGGVVRPTLTIDLLSACPHFLPRLYYQFSGSWDEFANHASNMYAGGSRGNSVDSAVRAYLAAGVRCDKIVLGELLHLDGLLPEGGHRRCMSDAVEY